MGEPSQSSHDVFLSYSSHDKAWADAAVAALERHQIRCWIAPRDITPGDEWGAAIVKGINGSRMMALIFSAHANASSQVRREVDRAITQGMTVMPIRIEDVRPEGAMEFNLSNTHWLDAFTSPAERHLEMIARAVGTLLGPSLVEASGSNRPGPRTPLPDDPKRLEEVGPAGVGPSSWAVARTWPLGLVAAAVLAASAFGILMVVRGEGKPPVAVQVPTPVPAEGLARATPGPPTPPATIPPAATPPPTIPPRPVEKPALPATRPNYLNEFNNGNAGLPADLAAPYEPGHGISDGVYYIYSQPGRWTAWVIRRFTSESLCEVVGRVWSDKPNSGSWSVLAISGAGEHRGIRVNLNVKGELFLEPNPGPNGKEFVRVDPKIGPIIHPAIKPGNVYNKLQLVLKKREVIVFVNDVQVCPPVKLEYDLIPYTLEFGAAGAGKRRAEFDRLEVRDLVEPETDKPKGATK